MTDDMIALGRRAVACKGWRWMPGMLAVEWAAPGMGLTGGRPVRIDVGWHEVGVWLPDLSDAATLGCLLALVREAWVAHGCASVWTLSSQWFARGVRHARGPRKGREVLPSGVAVYGTPHDELPVGDSEAEALVVALEMAQEYRPTARVNLIELPGRKP